MKSGNHYFCALVMNIVLISLLYSQETIIFEDNFFDNKNAWPVRNTDEVFLSVDKGSYTVEHKREEEAWLIWKTINLDQNSNFKINVQLRHVSGISNKGFGVVWGMKDVDNYLTFNISDNGYFRFAKEENNSWMNIIEWEKHSAIQENNRLNNLVIEKKDLTYYFYGNNVLLKSYSYLPFMGDKIGFIVWGTQRFLIDRIVVTQFVLEISDEDELLSYGNLRKQIYKTAVVEFSELGDLNIPDAGKIVSDWMSTALNKTKVFEVYERISLSQLLEEHKLGVSGIADEETIAQIGKIHGVQAIVTGNISKFGNLISVNVKLIDVETAKILDSSNRKTEKMDEIPSLIDKLAMELATE